MNTKVEIEKKYLHTIQLATRKRWPHPPMIVRCCVLFAAAAVERTSFDPIPVLISNVKTFKCCFFVIYRRCALKKCTNAIKQRATQTEKEREWYTKRDSWESQVHEYWGECFTSYSTSSFCFSAIVFFVSYCCQSLPLYARCAACIQNTIFLEITKKNKTNPKQQRNENEEIT